MGVAVGGAVGAGVGTGVGRAVGVGVGIGVGVDVGGAVAVRSGVGVGSAAHAAASSTTRNGRATASSRPFIKSFRELLNLRIDDSNTPAFAASRHARAPNAIRRLAYGQRFTQRRAAGHA